MKISFLGTGHGIPDAEHHCSCTLLETNDKIYVFDPGAPLTDLLLQTGRDVNSVKDIFVTHCHADHTFGMIHFIQLSVWAFKSAEFCCYLPQPEFKEVLMPLLSLNEKRAFPADRIGFETVSEGTFFDDGTVKVTAYRTRHLGTKPSYSFLVEAENKKILFSGDLSPELKYDDFPVKAYDGDVDMMILEMAHFSPEQCEPYLKKCKVGQLWFNHVNYPTEKYPAILLMKDRFGYPVYLAHDGDEVTL